MLNNLDPDQDRHFVGPDLGPNYLQRLSAYNKSCRQQGNFGHMLLIPKSHELGHTVCLRNKKINFILPSLVFCLFDLILYVHSTIFQLCGTVLPGFNQY